MEFKPKRPHSESCKLDKLVYKEDLKKWKMEYPRLSKFNRPQQPPVMPTCLVNDEVLNYNRTLDRVPAVQNALDEIDRVNILKRIEEWKLQGSLDKN